MSDSRLACRRRAAAILARLSDGTIECELEQQAGSFVRRTQSGGVDFISPIPCPFDYGRVCGEAAPDGSELDVIMLGVRGQLAERFHLRALGVAVFVDAGVDDFKLLASPEGHSDRWQRLRVVWFMRTYVWLKRVLLWLRGEHRPTHYHGLILLKALRHDLLV